MNQLLSLSQLQPRVVRIKDAYGYLGMSRDVFNKEVRPYITEIPIGTQGIGFDRVDLDAWFEHYKQRSGRSSKSYLGETLCQKSNIEEAESTGTTVKTAGLSTKRGENSEYTSSLKRIAQMKPKSS